MESSTALQFLAMRLKCSLIRLRRELSVRNAAAMLTLEAWMLS
jgi:hypothetical protein